jgi:hypothetical protein
LELNIPDPVAPIDFTSARVGDFVHIKDSSWARGRHRIMLIDPFDETMTFRVEWAAHGLWVFNNDVSRIERCSNLSVAA